MVKGRLKKGTLILDQIEFTQVYERKVGKGNISSGKISMPFPLIGKTVYVIVPKEEAMLV